MKATLQSTTSVVDMRDCEGRPFMARVWEGVTEAGVAFTAYVGIVQVHTDANRAEFERDLRNNKLPSEATRLAIGLRMVL